MWRFKWNVVSVKDILEMPGRGIFELNCYLCCSLCDGTDNQFSGRAVQDCGWRCFGELVGVDRRGGRPAILAARRDTGSIALKWLSLHHLPLLSFAFLPANWDLSSLYSETRLQSILGVNISQSADSGAFVDLQHGAALC
jgi:hypothetical protein